MKCPHCSECSYWACLFSSAMRKSIANAYSNSHTETNEYPTTGNGIVASFFFFFLDPLVSKLPAALSVFFPSSSRGRKQGHPGKVSLSDVALAQDNSHANYVGWQQMMRISWTHRGGKSGMIRPERITAAGWESEQTVVIWNNDLHIHRT